MTDGRNQFQSGANQGGMSRVEIAGALVFLGGCLPAASLAKAAARGTDLGAEGLGGAAKLASTVSQWVGLWPGLMIGVVLAILGATMVVGGLRRDAFKAVVGVIVCGMCLSAIASSFNPGAGGLIGDTSGGALARALGPWLAALLSVGILVFALWLSFAPEGRSGSGGGKAVFGAATAAVKKKLEGRPAAREEDGVGNRGRRSRKIQTKSRRQGDPVTLGDALARGGAEGVTHDEAAALAPDASTLAYMENVWRKASESFTQADPVPPSPYPTDVRLKGEIPTGAIPFDPASKAAAEAEARATAEAPAPAPVPVPTEVPAPRPAAEIAFETSDQDVAPFDFADELSAPVPLTEDPGARSGANDPFGGAAPAMELSAEAAEAFGAASPAVEQPKELPEGVRPLEESTSGADVRFEASSAPAVEPPEASGATTMPAEMTSPPRPSWEVEEPELDEIADVDPSGHWPRREAEGPEALVPAPAAPVDLPEDTLADIAEAVDAEEDELAELALEDTLEAAVEVAAATVEEPAVPAEPAADLGEEAPLAHLEPLVFADPEALQDEVPVQQPEVQPEEVAGATEESPSAALTFDEAPLEAEIEVEEDHEVPAEVEEAEAEEDPEAEYEEAEEGEDPEAEYEEAEEGEDPEAEYEEAEEEEDPEAEYEEAEEGEDPEAEHEEAEEGEDPEAEYEEAEEEEDPEAEYEEAEEGEDPEAEYEEAEEGEDPEAEAEEEEAAELEEGEEEEYEYVDEDGNPIDPADMEDWEVVDEGDEESEEAELEEVEDELEDEEEGDEGEAEADPEASDEEWEEEWEEEAESGELEEEAEEPEPEPEPEPAAEGSEPTVVLEPQAPPAGADAGRLLQAGRLVLGEGRVAVSLLQKEMDLAFDEACGLLDDLQAQGLIGPYKGGKSRDILLSAEEWEARFAPSAPR